MYEVIEEFLANKMACEFDLGQRMRLRNISRNLFLPRVYK